jgi:hypothetical protein
MATPSNHGSKYSRSLHSLLDLSNKKIPAHIKADLEDIGAHSLTNKTWSSYKTAERLLAKCCKENKIKKELPVSEDTIMIFIHWLVTARGLKAGTINGYLAGIRQLHLAKGLPDPNFRAGAVNIILKGLQNKEARNKLASNNLVKQPITEETMLKLKANLRTWKESPTNHRLIWAVATSLYHGLFRIRELVSEREDTFDPAFTLLTNDVHISPTSHPPSIQYQLKAPKEDKKHRSKVVDVYGTGGPTCPVNALSKWMTANNCWPPNQPAFRWQDGRPLTAKRFNTILKEQLGNSTSEGQRVFTSHCFRIGAASRLGAIGHSDEDLKSLGRWSSRAFEEYLLHPRTKRAALAKQLPFK